MTPATVTALAQVAGLALSALAEILRAPPRDDQERAARDAATMALMEQVQAAGQALRVEIEAPRAPPSAQAHEVEPPGLIQTGLSDNAHDARRALAATIWGEARSEPLAGKIAVAHVVRNRAAAPGWWGRDVRTCCLSPGQFSCWWDAQGQAVRLVDETDAAFRSCLDIAGQVMTGDLADPTGGADHYHRDDCRPHWAAGRKPIRVIGRHVFYKLGQDGQG